jgi:serine/threonine protein kinase
MKVYAAKVVNKSACVEANAAGNLLREKAILERVRHPLIANMIAAFQDDTNIYMILDWLPGGDLRYHIRTTGALPEDAILSIAAELVCVLVALHSQGVVHRDVKPANVVLDAEGHVHLVDFNVAGVILPMHGVGDGGSKCVSDSEPLDAYSRPFRRRTGTVAYMCPEVAGNEAYGASCDWWSLGVTLYELSTGHRPFVGEDSAEVIAGILDRSKSVQWSKRDISRLSNDLRDLVSRLLEKDVSRRLIDAEGVMRHPLFSEISWPDVRRKRLRPVFVPDPQVAHFCRVVGSESICCLDVVGESRPDCTKLQRSRGMATVKTLGSPTEYESAVESIVRPPRSVEALTAVFTDFESDET